MKPLIIFYSRTGTTKKAAQAMADIFDCDVEEIFDTKNRDGAFGYLKSGKEATLKKLTEIKRTKNNPALYDLVIIGTPVWAFTISSPIRTYITQNKVNFNKVAFFCTMGNTGSKNAFRDMQKLSGKEPVALLELKTKEVVSGNYFQKVQEFINKLK